MQALKDKAAGVDINNGGFALQDIYLRQAADLQKQIDDANTQAQALQRLTDATQLLSNIG